jgi:hypothetical protein
MVSEEDIAEFGDLWSLTYYVFAREMVDSFGEEGEEALGRAIRSYGRARGLRLKRRHGERGLPVNLRSLFEHYDMPACPYEKIWRAKSGTDLGLIYCENFHHAMWQAYRPDLKVEMPEILTKDDPHCKFIVTQPKTEN